MNRETFITRIVPPLAFTVALFLLWELACQLFKIPPTILPAPSEVFAALWKFRAPIVENSWVTLWTTLAGFALATVFGLLLGIAVGWHRAIYAGVYPVLVGFNSIPKVAVVPVLNEVQLAPLFCENWKSNCELNVCVAVPKTGGGFTDPVNSLCLTSLIWIPLASAM